MESKVHDRKVAQVDQLDGDFEGYDTEEILRDHEKELSNLEEIKGLVYDKNNFSYTHEDSDSKLDDKNSQGESSKPEKAGDSLNPSRQTPTEYVAELNSLEMPCIADSDGGE